MERFKVNAATSFLQIHLYCSTRHVSRNRNSLVIATDKLRRGMRHISHNRITLALKRNKIMTLAARRMQLKMIKLSKKSQTQKNKTKQNTSKTKQTKFSKPKI